jgi:hypothetical protein
MYRQSQPFLADPAGETPLGPHRYDATVGWS